MAKTSITVHDDRGTILAVGDSVVKTGIDEGAPTWATRGVVVGFGRTRVRVQWSGWSYDAVMPHHAIPTRALEDGGRKVWAIRLDPTGEKGPACG